MKRKMILKSFKEDLLKCSRKSPFCFLWLKIKYWLLSIFVFNLREKRILLKKLRRMDLLYKWRDNYYKEKIKTFFAITKAHMTAILKSLKG